MIGFAAHLRVYEPIGALPESERTRWTAYVDNGSAPSRPLLMEREHSLAVASAARINPRLRYADDTEQAYVRHVDGLTYVCPWRLQLRTWDALAEFRAGLPDQIVDAFVPTPLAAVAADEAEAFRAANPEVDSPIRSVGWQIPVTWFVLFEADERRLVLGDRRAGAQDGGLDRALLYLTAMSRARRRLARALHVMQRSLENVATDALVDLGRWLEEWHPHSLVELDYGGLVHLMDDETLSADTSVADVAAALQCLADSDGSGAAAHYERITERWSRIAALEHAN